MSHAATNRTISDRDETRAAAARSDNGGSAAKAKALSPKRSGLVRAAGRPIAVVDFEEALVTFFVEAAEILGVPKSVAAIYAICFASPEPLSFSEINERLEISSGSISQGVRILRNVGALKIAQASRIAQSMKGRTVAQQSIDSRTVKQMIARSRDRYEPDLELRKMVTHFLENRLSRQLQSGHSQLKSILKNIPADVDGSANVLRVRLKSLMTWHDKACALLPVTRLYLELT